MAVPSRKAFKSIEFVKNTERSALEALATLVRKNKLKIIVEVGGTLNHDWQDQAGEKSAQVELAKAVVKQLQTGKDTKPNKTLKATR